VHLHGVERAIKVTKLPDWDLQSKCINAYVVAVVRAERERTPNAHRIAAAAARQGISFVRRRKKYFTDRSTYHEQIAQQMERERSHQTPVPDDLNIGETDGMWIWLLPREQQERVQAIATYFCPVDKDLSKLSQSDIHAERFEKSRAIKVLFSRTLFAVQPL